MKPTVYLLVAWAFLSGGSLLAQQSWIRINQLGYLPHSGKVAVLVSKEQLKVTEFELCEALTDRVVW
jgi:endoglucanase